MGGRGGGQKHGISNLLCSGRKGVESDVTDYYKVGGGGGGDLTKRLNAPKALIKICFKPLLKDCFCKKYLLHHTMKCDMKITY